MLRARDEMDRRYAEPLDVPHLAAIAHLSASQFGRVFKTVYGETPHRYLQRRRVERAMTLLRQTDRRSPTSRGTSASRASAPSAGPSATWSAARRRSPRAAPAGARPLLRRRLDQAARGGATLPVADSRPGDVSEKRGVARVLNSVLDMTTNHITSLHIRSVPRLDQDEALDSAPPTSASRSATHRLGFTRWLTVERPGQDTSVCPSSASAARSTTSATAAQVRELVTKGALGGLFLQSGDVHATYAALVDAGVEVTQEPVAAALRHRLRHPRPVRQPVRISQPNGRLLPGGHRSSTTSAGAEVLPPVEELAPRPSRDRAPSRGDPGLVPGASGAFVAPAPQ